MTALGIEIDDGGIEIVQRSRLLVSIDPQIIQFITFLIAFLGFGGLRF